MVDALDAEDNVRFGPLIVTPDDLDVIDVVAEFNIKPGACSSICES